MSAAELELYWGMHGSIVYDGIRQYIYGTAVPPDPVAVTNAKIDIFMAGIKAAVTNLLK